MPRHCADAQAAGVLRDEIELADPVQVDQGRRLEQAEIEHRDEALSAGQDFGVAAVAREHPHGVADAVRGMICECRRLHRWRYFPTNTGLRFSLKAR